MNNKVNYYLQLSQLQIAAECFWDKWDPKDNPNTSDWTSSELASYTKENYTKILTDGNLHSSKLTDPQAEEFFKNYEVVAHKQNTATGFSGTLFKAKRDIAGTDIKENQFIMGFRSTEFVEDQIRDSAGSNTTIKNTGFAWGQIADMEDWYAELNKKEILKDISSSNPLRISGYSLGGHLATSFGLLRQEDGTINNYDIYTFNGAGVGVVKSGNTLTERLAIFKSIMAGDGEFGNDPFAGEPDYAPDPNDSDRTILTEAGTLRKKAKDALAICRDLSKKIEDFSDTKGNQPFIPEKVKAEFNQYTLDAKIHYANLMAGLTTIGSGSIFEAGNPLWVTLGKPLPKMTELYGSGPTF